MQSQVESFKTNQGVDRALHCKFDHLSGDAGDDSYHHLQLDAVAIFVLYLVQMTASGLQIIFNTDEVAFVQNLVYYLERSYRSVEVIIILSICVASSRSEIILLNW